jgi:hypothetical protein
METPPTVLVAGAFGVFGRTLVHDLLRHSTLSVHAGGRGRSNMAVLQQGLEPALRDRITPVLCDLNDLRSVASALTNVQGAICAAGPYQEMPLHLLEACQRRSLPYIDMADDRGFVRRARAIVRPENSPAGIGWSTAPALSALLARLACEGFEAVEEIQIQLAPGNRGPRGSGTISSFLDSLAKPFTVWGNDGWRSVLGWSNPMTFNFPAPIGPREGFLVDVPDHDLFPPLFLASRVEFRAGAEFRIQNRAASSLASLSGFYGFDWRWAAGLFRRLLSVTSFLGSDAGALGVRLTGLKANLRTRRTVCLSAQHHGEYMPVLPAAVMAPRLLSGQAVFQGLLPLDRWLSREDLEAECAKRGLVLSVEEKPA